MTYEPPGVFISDISPRYRMPPRPVIVTTQVSAPRLLVSYQDAYEVLGEEAPAIRDLFIEGRALRGVWAVPHPDREDT
jgi:hypothetical protein